MFVILYPASNANYRPLWRIILCIVFVMLPKVESHNCASDTHWKFKRLIKTLQGWLDTQKKGNITGQTGEFIFKLKLHPSHQALFGLGPEAGGKMDTSTQKKEKRPN